jgi:hypothetical protein
MTGNESDAQGPLVQGTSTHSFPDELQATVMAALAADKHRKSRKMYRVMSFLKSNFAESMESVLTSIACRTPLHAMAAPRSCWNAP